MVSRRVVVGGGLAVVAGGAGLHLAGRDDDLLRALGARPRPMPDAADTVLLDRAVADQTTLVASVDTLDGVDTTDLVVVLRGQLDALGGQPTTPSTAPPTTGTPDTVAAAVSAASRRRQADALEAVSPDLARLLASLSAGQAQVARVLRSRTAGT